MHRIIGTHLLTALSLLCAESALAQTVDNPPVESRPDVVREAASRGYERVLALRPVGYWPADEGKGSVLYDRSGNANHGTIYSVPWKDGSLVFENDVYQWIQVPCRESYRGRNFSIGGWVFSTLHKRKRAGGEKEFRFGALIIGQPFRQVKGGKLKWSNWGGRLEADGAMLRFGLPDKGGLSRLEVVSGGEAYVPCTAEADTGKRAREAHRASPDVLGFPEDGIGLQSGQWQHIIYTYDQSGEAKLYIDGELTHSARDVPYTPSLTPFVFGGGRWGTFNLGGTLSMAGSLKDMVIFDRTLSQEEIRKLAAMTKPSGRPGEIAVADDTGPDLPDGPDPLIKIVKEESLDRDRRAEAVLKLARMGETASGAVHALAEELERMDRANGAHLPRVEEFFRNALIKALLDIDPKAERAKAQLAQSAAKPYLDMLDLGEPRVAEVKALARAGRYVDALDALRLLVRQGKHVVDPYFSEGDRFRDAREQTIHPQAYTPKAEHQGVAYSVGSGIWPTAGAEPITKDEFQKAVQSWAVDYPQAATWRKPDAPNLYRLKINKNYADGQNESAYLEGEEFVFDGTDGKVRAWSIAADRDGYLHVIGGQHNAPNRSYYIPGSWEKMGASRDNTSDDYPQVMYWVSKQPGDIGSLDFAGRRGDPRRVPCGWMNYMNFTQSPDGTLFLYGRDHLWTWGLYRYDAAARRWTGLGGSPVRMLASSATTNRAWHDGLGQTVPHHGPTPRSVLVAAWQPGAYNFCRSVWGIRFDRTGRMHLKLGILGVGEAGRMTSGPVYAYSDDLGATFHAADGRRLRLPLTVNPIPRHNGSISSGPLKTRYDLWASLVKELP